MDEKREGELFPSPPSLSRDVEESRCTSGWQRGSEIKRAEETRGREKRMEEEDGREEDEGATEKENKRRKIKIGIKEREKRRSPRNFRNVISVSVRGSAFWRQPVPGKRGMIKYCPSASPRYAIYRGLVPREKEERDLVE